MHLREARIIRLMGPHRTPRLIIATLLLVGGAAGLSAGPPATREVAADWRFVTGGRIRHAPAASPEGTIYCVSDDRTLRAVSSEGREMWRYLLGARPATSPLVGADGGVYVVTTDRLLRCLGPQGRLRWSRPLDTTPVADLACGRDGTLYLALEAGELEALDYRGRARWSFRFKADITASPSVAADGTLYVSTADRLFHALSPEGTQLWTLALPANGGEAAVGGSGVVYVSAFGIHAVSPDGRLLWELPVPHATTDPVVVGGSERGEIVLIGARDGSLHVVDASGARIAQVELGAEIQFPPVVRPDGSFVVVTTAGLVRVRASGAEAVALVRPKEAMGPALLLPSGVVVVGSEDWVLYGCSFEDEMGNGTATGSFWPQSRHDPARTGRFGAGEEPEGPAYLIMRELANIPLVEQKEQVLEAVRAHLEGHRFLPLRAAQMESLLVFLAQEGVQSPVYVTERRTADNPELRASACELLGELGTEGARRALITVVEKDPRSEVQSRAAEALGEVAYDPDGSTARALELMAVRRASEEGALLVVVRALRSVASATGPAVGLGDPTGTPPEGAADRPAWRVLVSLAADGYPDRVRAAARGALAELLGEMQR